MEIKQYPCERLHCHNIASSIHHIKSSFRGKRDDRPENLIALCLDHHTRIHNHNTFDNRAELLSITSKYADNTTMTGNE